MKRDTSKPLPRGHQLVFPLIWNNSLWARPSATQGMQISAAQKQTKTKQTKDNTGVKEKPKLTMLQGNDIWYQLSFNDHINLWAELPAKR